MKSILSIALCALVSLPAMAADSDQTPEEAIGAWQLEFTTPDEEHETPIIIVGRQRQELVAWYINESEPQAFSKVKMEGDTLQLTFRPEKYEGEVLATFSGHLKENGVCEGSIEYETNDGDAGSFDFDGKRIELSEFDNKSVWDISFVTPDGEDHEASMTALTKNSQTYGWYSSEDFELPAKEMTKSGDDIVMSLTVTTEQGDTVEVTFRGTIDGDEINGDADYTFGNDTGSFPFTGKKKA